MEDQETLHNQDLCGENFHRLVRPVVVHIGIHRALDGTALPQLLEVADQQVRFKGAGVVVILEGPLLVGLSLLPLLVAVVANDGDAAAEVVFQVLGQGGLSGAAAPGDADDDGAHTVFLPSVRFDSPSSIIWVRGEKARRT